MSKKRKYHLYFMDNLKTNIGKSHFHFFFNLQKGLLLDTESVLILYKALKNMFLDQTACVLIQAP